jgi:hypothetical protein
VYFFEEIPSNKSGLETESVTGNETYAMTFVFGTDLNYQRPTLVSIYSLLRNGIPKKERCRQINVVILSDGLFEEDNKSFGSSEDCIVRKLNINTSNSYRNVHLYFLDMESDQLKLWAENLKFSGNNLPEHP